MERFLGNYSSHIYALLRIVSGALFAMHGTQKLFAWPGDRPAQQLASLAGVAGVIELVAGILIAIGLFAGYAAFIASGQMAVAYFYRHFSPQAFWPIVNMGELAVLYCFIFLYIASRGSGILSVDSMRKGKRR
jgi:putative oxidoreductase